MELCRQYGRPFAAAVANQLLDKHLGKQENPRRCTKIWQRYYAEQQTQLLAVQVCPVTWVPAAFAVRQKNFETVICFLRQFTSYLELTLGAIPIPL